MALNRERQEAARRAALANELRQLIHAHRVTRDRGELAFNFAEKYRMPVILLLDETVGHISEKVTLPGPDEIEVYDRRKPSVPPEEYLRAASGWEMFFGRLDALLSR